MRLDSSEGRLAGRRAAQSTGNRDVAHPARGQEFAGFQKPRRDDGFKAAGDRREGDFSLVCRALALQQVDVQFPIDPKTELHPKRGC